MPKNDAVHTRLSHSLEAACIGRSLAEQVADVLETDKKEDAPWRVAAACLAHDIGNPPFGHAGEEAIRAFFRSADGQKHLAPLDPIQQADLRGFNGNAFGMLLLSRRVSVTRATLAAFAKYPNTSLKVPGDKLDKFCILASEVQNYSDVAHEAGTAGNGGWYRRSPLAVLTEAADDIAFGILDLEDGVEQGLIPEEDALELLRTLGVKGTRSIGRARAQAVNELVNRCAEAFRGAHEDINAGHWDQLQRPRAPLVSKLPEPMPSGLNAIKERCKRDCYRHREVTLVELASFEVVSKLLGELLPAYVGGFKGDKAERLERIVPLRLELDGDGPYERVLQAVAFLCGMTDRFALELFQTLSGTHVPVSTRFRSQAA